MSDFLPQQTNFTLVISCSQYCISVAGGSLDLDLVASPISQRNPQTGNLAHLHAKKEEKSQQDNIMLLMKTNVLNNMHRTNKYSSKKNNRVYIQRFCDL